MRRSVERGQNQPGRTRITYHPDNGEPFVDEMSNKEARDNHGRRNTPFKLSDATQILLTSYILPDITHLRLGPGTTADSFSFPIRSRSEAAGGHL